MGIGDQLLGLAIMDGQKSGIFFEEEEYLINLGNAKLINVESLSRFGDCTQIWRLFGLFVW